jgi:NADPH2:quinone reductase
MRAVRVHAPGGSDALRIEQVPRPTPGASEALVRVEYAGVNFIDIYKRTGLYKLPLPATIGEEGAGLVESVGDAVSDLRVGDRVAWASVLGAYAEYAVVPATRLVPVPKNVETRIAAAAMLQGMTAHYLATATYALKKGDRCLIHAAAGGVGLLLVQIAKLRGAYVIGTAGSDEKAALASKAGADEMIVYTRQDFVAEVKRITESKGVNVVYDSVGQSTFLKGLDVLVPRGMMVTFGQSSGAIPSFDPLLLSQKGSLVMTRPTLAHYIATREELLKRAGDVFAWIGRGVLEVRIGAEFPLDDVTAAHRALEGRQTTGKVLLRVTA